MNNETKLLQGSMNGAGLKIGIVCARFNSIFVEQLLSGAEDSLVRHGVDAKDITVAWVPGSFETPLVLQRMAATGKFDALIGLGVVIQGATQHAQMINSEVSKAYAQIRTAVPPQPPLQLKWQTSCANCLPKHISNWRQVGCLLKMTNRLGRLPRTRRA